MVSGDEAPKETVTAGSTEIKNASYYCGKTDHLRECKPGETPTVTNPTGGTSSSDDAAKKKTKPQNPPQNISDGAAKGQAQEGVAPNPNAGGNGNTTGGAPANPK